MNVKGIQFCPIHSSLEARVKVLEEALSLFVQVYEAPMTSEYSGAEALASAMSAAREALNAARKE